jgi:hypothetical protein
MLHRLWLLPSRRERSLSNPEKRAFFKYMAKELLKVLQINLAWIHSDANIQVAQQPFDEIRIGVGTSVVSTNQVPERLFAL